MNPRPIAFLLLLCACLLLPAFVSASGYFTFTAPDDVSGANVTAEIDGKPVEIVDFFQVDTASDNSAFLTHPAGRRQIVFLFDLIFSSTDQVIQARKTTLEFLQKAGKDDLIAVAGIATTGLRLYCAPTADRDQVIAGLNSIGKDRLEGMSAGPEGNFYPATFGPAAAHLQPYEDDVFARNLKTFGLGEKRKQDHVFILVQGLVDLAHALLGVQGRKNVVFFTPGFDTKGISLNLDLDQKRSDSKTAPTMKSTGEPSATLDSITNSYRNIEDVAAQGPPRRPRQHGVEVIPELYDGVDSHVQVVNTSPDSNGFLKDLAEKTGGHYFQQSCNVDEVLQAERKFYVIQWQDTGRNEWKALNNIKISAGDHKIVAPQRWLAPRPVAEQTAEEKRMHIGESVYKDFTKPSEAYRYWADIAYEEGKSKLPCFIQIPGAELLKEGDKDRKLEFYGYVLAADGSVLDAMVLPVELQLSNKSLKERIASSGLKVWSLLLGREEPLTIRSVIVDSDTGETVTKSLYMDVRNAGLTMSNPFVPATNFNWVVWPKPQEELTRRGVAVQYPYRMGKDLFFPDLSPEMKPGSGVVYFRLYNVLPESKNPPVKFHLLDSRGKSAEIQDFHLMQKPGDLGNGGIELFWTISCLPAVQPGLYRIKVGILDPVRKQVVVRELQNLRIPGP